MSEEKNNLLHAQYRAALERNKSLEGRLREIEEELEQSQEKVRRSYRYQAETNYYRSLLHRLRSHWYLRPFIPCAMLEFPQEDAVHCWYYRGARFDPPSNKAGNRRHRVLIVGHVLGAKLFGSENSLLETISAIDPDHFDVFAVFPQPNDRVFTTLQAHVQGIAVVKYSWWSKERPFDTETVSKFEKIIRRQKIDLVHANTIMLSDPLLAARRVNIPAITNAREIISLDDHLREFLGASPSEIARAVCENASYILANSAATLADYPCGRSGSYIYNSIDARAFDFPNSVNPGCIKVGLVSSNLAKKGVLDFLELARRAETVLPALQFYLVGPETKITEGWRADPEHLPRNFHMRGYFSRLSDAYRDLNIVLNLSRFAESFGRTVAEAMAARRPVVAYRYGALPELIDDGKDGFLVPYLDLSLVLERLHFFAQDPERIVQFGEVARARIIAQCSPEKARQALNAIYEQLISESQAKDHKTPAPSNLN